MMEVDPLFLNDAEPIANTPQSEIDSCNVSACNNSRYNSQILRDLVSHTSEISYDADNKNDDELELSGQEVKRIVPITFFEISQNKSWFGRLLKVGKYFQVK